MCQRGSSICALEARGRTRWCRVCRDVCPGRGRLLQINQIENRQLLIDNKINLTECLCPLWPPICNGLATDGVPLISSDRACKQDDVRMKTIGRPDGQFTFAVWPRVSANEGHWKDNESMIALTTRFRTYVITLSDSVTSALGGLKNCVRYGRNQRNDAEGQDKSKTYRCIIRWIGWSIRWHNTHSTLINIELSNIYARKQDRILLVMISLCLYA